MRHEPVTPSSDTDRYNPDRFLTVQPLLFETALGELRAGRKGSHWMECVFPERVGLGYSTMAVHFKGLDEMRAYLISPKLAATIKACTPAGIGSTAPSPNVLFGSPYGVDFASSTPRFDLTAGSDTSLLRSGLALL